MKKNAQGYYCTSVTLADGSKKYVKAKSQRELKTKIAALRDEERQGLIHNDMLVGEWAAVWMEKYKQSARPNTVRMYKGTYNTHIYPELATMRLDQVKQVHIIALYNKTADKSRSLQDKVRLTTNQLFKTAYENGLIVRNPAEGVKMPSNKAVQHVKALSPAECKTLRESLLSCANSKYAAFALLCLDCGLRKEEAAGIQWNDISGRTLTINRAIVYASGHLDESMQLKTEQSHRTVPLPDHVLTMIRTIPKQDAVFVFANEITGGPPSERELRAWSRKLNPYHPHQLRHTYCTNLARAGVDLRTASKLMGHATIQMTANIYTNLEAEDIATSNEKVLRMFA